MDDSTIKENIRRIRKARRFTQEEMAHHLDISLTAYRDLEKGRTGIVNDNLPKIADILETSAEEIVLGYRPVREGGRQIEEMRTEYGERITTLQKQVENLEELVRTLKESNEDKNEIIKMLKKSLGHE